MSKLSSISSSFKSRKTFCPPTGYLADKEKPCLTFKIWIVCAFLSFILRAYPCTSPSDQSRYVPSQWEMSLQNNDISHWLCSYLAWSLFLGSSRISRWQRVNTDFYHLTAWDLNKYGRHLADSIFNQIFLNENDCDFIQICLKCFPMYSVCNKSVLF